MSHLRVYVCGLGRRAVCMSVVWVGVWTWHIPDCSRTRNEHAWRKQALCSRATLRSLMFVVIVPENNVMFLAFEHVPCSFLYT